MKYTYQVIFIVILLAIAGTLGFMKTRTLGDAENIALQWENTLLKKMLGQIESDIATLGPATVDDDNRAAGKLVWDKVIQGGYLFVTRLPASPEGYSLWVRDETGEPVLCGHFTATAAGEVQGTFRAARPVFKPREFFLTRGATADDIIVRGALHSVKDPELP